MDTATRIAELSDKEIEKTDYETVRGKPIPNVNHAFIQKRLVVKLDVNYGDKYEVLPEINIDVIDRGRVPDIAICDLSVTFKAGEDTIKLEGVPLGVVEILSPKQSLSELVHKSLEYFKVGVKSYWLVLPDLRSIYVFDQPQNYQVFTWKDQLKDDVLGLELDLKEIFK